jgi:hypothetical protein
VQKRQVVVLQLELIVNRLFDTSSAALEQWNAREIEKERIGLQTTRRICQFSLPSLQKKARKPTEINELNMLRREMVSENVQERREGRDSDSPTTGGATTGHRLLRTDLTKGILKKDCGKKKKRSKNEIRIENCANVKKVYIFDSSVGHPDSTNQ